MLAPHLILWCLTPEVRPVPPPTSPAEVSSNLELNWWKQLSSFLPTSPRQLPAPFPSVLRQDIWVKGHGREFTQGCAWEQTAFVQLRPCLTAFNLRHGLVCTAKEIKVATRGFPFCACGHNPTRLPSLVFIIWKANLEEQTDMGDEEKDKLRKVIVFIEKT